MSGRPDTSPAPAFFKIVRITKTFRTLNGSTQRGSKSAYSDPSSREAQRKISIRAITCDNLMLCFTQQHIIQISTSISYISIRTRRNTVSPTCMNSTHIRFVSSRSSQKHVGQCWAEVAKMLLRWFWVLATRMLTAGMH